MMSAKIGVLGLLAVVMGVALVACGITPTPIPAAQPPAEPTQGTDQEGSSSIDALLRQGNEYATAGDFVRAAA